jgi:hypothetical protein
MTFGDALFFLFEGFLFGVLFVHAIDCKRKHKQ